ncbi:histidine phosphatase family protein [Aquipuribacter nitratireducens]|uniref:Histidine phosphatase family protein n=1 Tax=Aquipuribacter nitratireducens TaxID=650104 RepID=A0ABW0GRC3_9MICO
MRTTVHLLRHGEVHNPAQVLYGRLEGYRLSERGQRMAARVADDLSRGDVVAVVASPLQRAQETAAPLARMLGVEVGTDPRLIESANVFEGLTIGTGGGSLRKPVHWRHLWNPFRPSWGEPYEEIATRMLAAVADARDAARGHEIVCVSHQLPIWTARNAAVGRRTWHDPRRRECALASLTSFRFDDDRLVGVGYREPAAGV